MVSRVGFCKVHGFPYSPRKGTAAAAMDNQVPAAVKKARNKQLLGLGESIARKFFIENLNTYGTVLFEEEEGEFLTGYTDNYIKVYLPLKKGEGLINELVTMQLLNLHGDGVLVDA